MFTTTQWLIVALVLVAGWLLGLASHPGGKTWKTRYAAEREAHAANRKEAEARIAAADRRNAELEREHARLARTAPVTAATIAPRATAAANRARPAYPSGERRGWFDWGQRPRV
jgi:hypothetical protein